MTLPQHFNEPLEIEVIEHPNGNYSEVQIRQDNPLFDGTQSECHGIDIDTIPALCAELMRIYESKQSKQK